MRLVEDGAAGRLVDAAALHADQAVLDQRPDADAVAAADLVEQRDELVAAAVELLAVHRDRDAGFEVDGHVSRPGWAPSPAARSSSGTRPSSARRPGCSISAPSWLMCQRLRSWRVDLLLGLRDRDAVLLRVVDGGLAVVRSSELRVLPRRDDLQLGVERHVGQLEAHLVVALAGGAVADGVGAGLLRDSDLVLARSAAARCWCRAGSPARRSRAPGASGSSTPRRTPCAGP